MLNKFYKRLQKKKSTQIFGGAQWSLVEHTHVWWSIQISGRSTWIWCSTWISGRAHGSLVEHTDFWVEHMDLAHRSLVEHIDFWWSTQISVWSTWISGGEITNLWLRTWISGGAHRSLGGAHWLLGGHTIFWMEHMDLCQSTSHTPISGGAL